MRFIDLTGQTFGLWTVIERIYDPARQKRTLWSCRCQCGTVAVVDGGDLREGGSRGCYPCRGHQGAPATHGHTRGYQRSRTYRAWDAMLWRCSPDSNARRWYFDRGIRVCDRWKSFEDFLADMGECPLRLTLDRIDNDKGYEPGNCQWATMSEQVKNRRSLPRKKKRSDAGIPRANRRSFDAENLGRRGQEDPR